VFQLSVCFLGIRLDNFNALLSINFFTRLLDDGGCVA
jgi:hypothetical protein